MLTDEQIKDKIIESCKPYSRIARDVDISEKTIYRVANGKTNLSYTLKEKLSKYFEGKDNG